MKFGANDQKATANITLLEYQTNLQNLALDVKESGGTPVSKQSHRLLRKRTEALHLVWPFLSTYLLLLAKLLLTPMSRRDYTSEYNVTQNLANQRTYTIYAARNTSSIYVDFNLASTEYLNAIGNASAQTYDLLCTDGTHLNSWGSVVFGRMFADLLLGHPPEVGVDVDFVPNPSAYFTQWFEPNATLSEDIWDGVPSYGGDCPLGL